MSDLPGSRRAFGVGVRTFLDRGITGRVCMSRHEMDRPVGVEPTSWPLGEANLSSSERMAESRALEAQGVNPVPASNRPSHLASWLSVADGEGVEPPQPYDHHRVRTG